jgi:hypothetical protein
MKNLKQFIAESVSKAENAISVKYDFIVNNLFFWDNIIDEYGSWEEYNDEFDEDNNPETILSQFIDKVKAKTMKVYIMPETMDYIKPAGVKANQVNIVSESEYEAMTEKYTWEPLIEVYNEWTVEVSENNALLYANQYGDANNYLIVFE